MTKRRQQKAWQPVDQFCPSWGMLLDSYVPEGSNFSIDIGDSVKLQFKKYEEIFTATVMKIVADKETGKTAEVTVVLQGKQKQWRTVTPDKIRRIPRNAQEKEEDMKVSGYTGELPKRTGGGRTRKANPFDEHITKGGSHQVVLEKDDDPATVLKQLRAAATFGGKSVEAFHDEPNKKILFKVVPRKTRKKATK